MIKAHVLDSIQNAKRAGIEEIDAIMESGCMNDCKLHNLKAATAIVFYACQIEAMSVVGEAVVNSYATKRVLTPGTKTTTVDGVVTTTGTPIGTTIGTTIN